MHKVIIQQSIGEACKTKGLIRQSKCYYKAGFIIRYSNHQKVVEKLVQKDSHSPGDRGKMIKTE